ncbi:MAG: hypothetical protein AAGA85_28185, partial [Bacteroidota bacterium]
LDAMRDVVLWLLVGPLLSVAVVAQDFNHPRGLITRDEIPALREKVKTEPFLSMMKGMERQFQQLKAAGEWEPSVKGWEYPAAEMAALSAQLYLLTGDTQWAESAMGYTELLLEDELVFKNRLGRGLTKGLMLRNAMMAYDYCYDAWPLDFRKRFSLAVYDAIFTLSANMGRSANYDMASNWNGVRYGAVLFASILWDDYEGHPPKENPINPLRWNAQKRVNDFALANLHPDGWNVESLGYFLYGWSFVMPALAAWSNTSSYPISRFPYYDRLLKAYKAWMVASVALSSHQSVGLKPDFSDDNPNNNSMLMPYAMRLFPDSIAGPVARVNEMFRPKKTWEVTSDGAFPNILYTTTHPENSMPDDWLHFLDPNQGVLVARNRYQDEHDVVAAYSVMANRRGHQGSDNQSFRLLGLGNVWAVGAGRTAYVAGQTGFFPDVPTTDQRHDKSVGEWLGTESQGRTYTAIGSGSCTGVEDHVRTFTVSYDSSIARAPAVVVVHDQSSNGKVWRMNTPEFNEVEVLEDGFLITGPNGSSLRARIQQGSFDRISTGQLRYGGATKRHNTGIGFEGHRYPETKYVDIHCDKEIEVILTLVDAGQEHPVPN